MYWALEMLHLLVSLRFPESCAFKNSSILMQLIEVCFTTPLRALSISFGAFTMLIRAPVLLRKIQCSDLCFMTVPTCPNIRTFPYLCDSYNERQKLQAILPDYFELRVNVFRCISAHCNVRRSIHSSYIRTITHRLHSSRFKLRRHDLPSKSLSRVVALS